VLTINVLSAARPSGHVNERARLFKKSIEAMQGLTEK